MTLVDLERPLRAVFRNSWGFRADYENLNEVRPILSATKILPMDCSFWQYKVYTDIGGSFLERGVKRQC